MTLSKELYEAIIQNRLESNVHKFTIDGTEYAQVSSYAPMYQGMYEWEVNTEMIVVDHDGNMFHLTLRTDRHDYDWPIEYIYELRYFCSMSASDAEKYFG